MQNHQKSLGATHRKSGHDEFAAFLAKSVADHFQNNIGRWPGFFVLNSPVRAFADQVIHLRERGWIRQSRVTKPSQIAAKTKAGGAAAIINLQVNRYRAQEVGAGNKTEPKVLPDSVGFVDAQRVKASKAMLGILLQAMG
jgi:hypothetical protein